MAPGRAPEGAPGKPDPKGNEGCRIRIVRIPGIINGWWVGGHINDRRIGRYDFDDLFGHIHYLGDIRLCDHNVRDINDLLLRGL